MASLPKIAPPLTISFCSGSDGCMLLDLGSGLDGMCLSHDFY